MKNYEVNKTITMCYIKTCQAELNSAITCQTENQNTVSSRGKCHHFILLAWLQFKHSIFSLKKAEINQ
jgi:hypothetical protein